MRSIRQRLVVLMVAAIGVVGVVTGFSIYAQARHEISEWEAARLAHFARVLLFIDRAGLRALADSPAGLRGSELGIEALEEADQETDEEDELTFDLLFAVRDGAGQWLVASQQLLAMGALQEMLAADPHESTLTLAQSRWHVSVAHDEQSGKTAWILEPALVRGDLASGMGKRLARPLAVALPVLALLIWWSIGRGLAPLGTLSQWIRTRDLANLEPLSMTSSPKEVRPLIDAVNHLFARLERSLQRERAFTADAAHELKTPLTAIKVQAQVALSTQDPGLRRLATERVVEAVDRSTHLAEQLLLLARLDESQPVHLARVDLAALVSEVVRENMDDASAKGMRLAMRCEQAGEIDAEPTLLAMAIHNLIENAIKYGRAEGDIEVIVQGLQGIVMVRVADNGPGVSDEQRGRLGDRFFRALDVPVSGSGLGLSIVARIAQSHGATLHFESGPGGRGLLVTLLFTMAGANPQQDVQPA